MNLSLPHRLYRYVRLKMNNAIIRVLFRNRQPEKKHFLSLCAIFKNEGKFFQEWLNYYLLAGVDHFYLYNNFSDDNYQEILKPYIDKGFVTLIDWPIPFGQYQAYQDCVEKYSAESNWIGFLDLDEFVVPHNTTDLKEYLKQYNKFPCVSCYWKMFGSNGIIKEDATKLITEQFTVCGDFMSFKSFLNTKFSGWISKKSNSPHFFRFKFFNRVCAEDVAYYSALRSKPKYARAQINHYYCKSYEYFCNKKQIGRQLDDKQKLSLDFFFAFENMACHADYRIFKYLVKLKTFDLNDFSKKSVRVLVCVHLYYREMWPEIKSRLQCITDEYDLFVTMTQNDAAVEEDISAFKSDAVVKIVENKGFDVAPFVAVLNGVDLSRYDYVIKLHTKRNVPVGHIINGFDVGAGKWRACLMSFLSSPEAYQKCRKAFETSPELGMTGNYRLICRKEPKTEYAGLVSGAVELLKKSGLPAKEYSFIMGTMFFCRTSLLKPLKALNLSINDFDVSSRESGNKLPYILEFFLGYSINAQGYEIKDAITVIPSRLYGAAKACSIVKNFIWRKKATSKGYIVKVCKIPVFRKKLTEEADV